MGRSRGLQGIWLFMLTSGQKVRAGRPGRSGSNLGNEDFQGRAICPALGSNFSFWAGGRQSGVEPPHSKACGGQVPAVQASRLAARGGRKSLNGPLSRFSRLYRLSAAVKWNLCAIAPLREKTWPRNADPEITAFRLLLSKDVLSYLSLK